MTQETSISVVLQFATCCKASWFWSAWALYGCLILSNFASWRPTEHILLLSVAWIPISPWLLNPQTIVSQLLMQILWKNPNPKGQIPVLLSFPNSWRCWNSCVSNLKNLSTFVAWIAHPLGLSWCSFSNVQVLVHNLLALAYVSGPEEMWRLHLGVSHVQGEFGLMHNPLVLWFQPMDDYPMVKWFPKLLDTSRNSMKFPKNPTFWSLWFPGFPQNGWFRAPRFWRLVKSRRSWWAVCNDGVLTSDQRRPTRTNDPGRFLALHQSSVGFNGGFQKMEVTPIAGWCLYVFVRENPIKMDDNGTGYPHLWKTPTRSLHELTLLERKSDAYAMFGRTSWFVEPGAKTFLVRACADAVQMLRVVSGFFSCLVTKDAILTLASQCITTCFWLALSGCKSATTFVAVGLVHQIVITCYNKNQWHHFPWVSGQHVWWTWPIKTGLQNHGSDNRPIQPTRYLSAKPWDMQDFCFFFFVYWIHCYHCSCKSHTHMYNDITGI